MPERSPSSPVANARGRILLIDDEPSILRNYARVLRSQGFAVHESLNGHSASAAIEASDYDTVVSDIGLPDMSGIDVLRAARSHDPDLPVVLITGAGDLTSAVAAVELGAMRYLLKPVDPISLSETVERGVRLRRMARIQRRAFELYGAAARERAERTELEARFRRALELAHMAFQPIVSWSARRAVAYEALVRTEEPTLRRPDLLFAAAEQLSRLPELGRLIRARVAQHMDQGPGDIFVNLHAHDLLDDELLSPSAPLSRVASRVVLELTERASLGGIPDLTARLSALRKLGFRLAVDDLGSGYAGLNSFTQIEPEVVKLDMALTRSIHEEPTKSKLVETMVGLCRELSVEVIAEGVESEAERATLVGLGCDLLQGYLFARPGAPFPVPSF